MVHTYHSGAYVYTHTQMIIKTKYTKLSRYIRILNNNAYHSITHTFSLILLLTLNTSHPMHNYCSDFSISINANKSIINLYCPIFHYIVCDKISSTLIYGNDMIIIFIF